MIGQPLHISDITVGRRFFTWGWVHPPLLLGKDRKELDLLHEITAFDDGLATIVDQHGVTRQFRPQWNTSPVIERDVHGGPYPVAWFDPFPEAPFDTLKAMGDVLLRETRYLDGRPLLMLATVPADGPVTARVIHPAAIGDSDSTYSYAGCRHTPLPGEYHGSVFVIEHPVALAPAIAEGLADGDLLLLSAYEAGVDPDNPSITKGDVAVLMHNMTPAAIGAWLPDVPVKAGTIHDNNPLRLGCWHELDMEICRSIARSEADEILVLALDVPGAKGTDTVHRHLSHSGINLFMVDALDDHLWNSDLDQGIWIGKEVAWHNAGDDGAEWDASWERATLADLERHGIDFAEIADHIGDLLDLPPDPATAQRIFELTDEPSV